MIFFWSIIDRGTYNDFVGKQKNAPTLDLHGYKQDEVADAVDGFIMSACRKGAKTVRIMPGKGKGIVKKEVMQYLKRAGYPWRYEKTPNGKNNEGVLVVFMD